MGEENEKDYALMRGYSALSHAYLRLGEFEKALNYCLKGLDYILQLEEIRYIFPKIDEMARMANHLYGSGPALSIYDFYIKLQDELPEPGSYIKSAAFMNMAQIYLDEGQLNEADRYISQAKNLIDSNDFRFRKPRVHMLSAALQLKQKDTLSAIASLEKAFEFANNIAAFDVLRTVSHSLATLYDAPATQEKSAKYEAYHLALSDSLFSKDTQQQIKILEAEREISEISKKNELLQLASKHQEERYKWLLLAFVLLVIMAGGSLYAYGKVSKKNELLFQRTKELTQEKLNHKKQMKPLEPTPSDVLDVVAEKNTSDTGKPITKPYIDEDIKHIILTKLERLENEEFYLNSKCSLASLADVLQTNQKYLSLVINHEKGSNFSNYLNELRINHLLDRLLEDHEFRSRKLSYIAQESGYNNLNTFYSAFKKRLGILPSFFIKQLNEEEKREDRG